MRVHKRARPGMWGAVHRGRTRRRMRRRGVWEPGYGGREQSWQLAAGQRWRRWGLADGRRRTGAQARGAAAGAGSGRHGSGSGQTHGRQQQPPRRTGTAAAATKGGSSCCSDAAMQLLPCEVHVQHRSCSAASQRGGRCGHADGASLALTHAHTRRSGAGLERERASGRGAPCTCSCMGHASSQQRRCGMRRRGSTRGEVQHASSGTGEAPRPHRSMPAPRAAAECGAAAAARVSGETGPARRLCRPCAAGTRAAAVAPKPKRHRIVPRPSRCARCRHASPSPARAWRQSASSGRPGSAAAAPLQGTHALETQKPSDALHDAGQAQPRQRQRRAWQARSPERVASCPRACAIVGAAEPRCAASPPCYGSTV